MYALQVAGGDHLIYFNAGERVQDGYPAILRLVLFHELPYIETYEEEAAGAKAGVEGDKVR